MRTRSTIERNGFSLVASERPAPPAGWETDSGIERRMRVTLAMLLGVPPADVLVEDQIPLPGVSWLVPMTREPVTIPLAALRPYDEADKTRVGDMAVAVRGTDDRWLVVTPDDGWPGPGTVILGWMAFNGLMLIPLAWLFTRRLVHPIQQLAHTANRAGRGDSGVEFSETGPGEVGALAAALTEMQRKVRGALEERTRLLAAIAHDLRTPLTRIRFRAEHAAPDHLDRIIADVERMDAMIESVIAFVYGEHAGERIPLDFGALVQSVVDDWTDTGARAEFTGVPGLIVHGDPLALRRMVSNVVDNTVKYAGNERCRVAREGDDVVLMVEDSGRGVSEFEFDRFLTPFERGDETCDPATGGVGLGLPIALGIARGHGGDLSLDRSELSGLRVMIRLSSN